MTERPLTEKTPVRKVALFDLDHTLLPLDSDFSWGEFTIRIGWTDPVEFKRRNQAFYEQYQAGVLDIHEYVRFATQAFCARTPEAAQQAHRQFMQEVILPAIRPGALDLLARHRAAGDEIAIVTATNEFVTRPIAQAFGVHELIAVELARSVGLDGVEGWFNGNIRGVPSFREGKVTRVWDWLARKGWSRADVELTFYSDSPNDLPLLDAVDHPVATNPNDHLRALATDRAWPILDLFSHD